MNQSINIVTNSLEYYDKNMEKYDKIISKIKYWKVESVDSDLEHSKIIFYDKNKKEIFKTRYEIIGLYNDISNTWVWAWSIPFFRRNSTYISKKILNYGLDIPPDTENRFLKSELITSRFRVSDKIQLDLHVSIASYISKKPMIYNLIYRDTNEYLNQQDYYKVVDNIDEINNYVSMYIFLLDYEDL